jgi:hypothetical protein
MRSRIAVHTVWRAALCLLLLAASVPQECRGAEFGQQSARSGEYDVKAALVYNFLKFVEWPTQAGTTNEMPLCILGSIPVPGPFNALQGQEIRGKKLVVIHLGQHDDLAGCQVIFLAGSYARSVGDVLRTVRGRAILTVGDTEGYAEKGIMINMFLEKKRVRFEINADQARLSGIRISVKLMRLANTVYGEALNGD